MALPSRLIGLGVALLLLLILLSASFVVARETQQGIVIRFGEPQPKIINPYKPGQEFGRGLAGLVPKWPFIDNVVWVDKRIMSVDMEQQQVLSTDQLRLNIDAFARFRIVDPLRMYTSARTVDGVRDALRPILGSALRNELGKVQFATLLSPERGQVMENIQASLNRVARQYGAEIVDVRIKRADLPAGTPLQSAFNRMRTAREQEALTIDAQGRREAQIIRADADAEAASIYAASFGKDPAFYDFYRAMQSYRRTFGTDGSTPQGSASAVLSPDSEYFRQFRDGGRP